MSATAQSNTTVSFAHAFDFSKLQYLQNKVEHLECQLKQALAYSAKKEAYANTLEEDLEHIINQLKRLEVVR